MTLPEEAMHALLPMHAVLSPLGCIRQAGPTLHKLSDTPLEGACFLEQFEVYRPRLIRNMAALLEAQGRKLSLRVRGTDMELKGTVVGTGDGGAVVNLSFGIAVVDAVRRYRLTSTDFASTDLSIEMLWLMEAKALAINASRSLNTRLQDAMILAEERAFTDTLTGLKNRRALDGHLDKLIRQRQAFSLMHLDLDLFKQVNDTHGHAAGDHVLRQAARVMLEETRKDDLVARVGGDEFIIVFANLTSPARLAELAVHLIKRIEEPVTYDDAVCRISASIGITICMGEEVTPASVVERADEALYASKRAGRARYSFYAEGDPEVPKAIGEKK